MTATSRTSSGPPPGIAAVAGQVTIPSVANLRDVGGHLTTTGGRVRTGLLYRSAELDHVADEDMPTLGRLGIRTVYDLRTEGERIARPDRLPAGATYRVADVLAGAPGESPAEMQRQFADPVAATRAFGGGRGVAFFRGVYRDLVALDSARAAYAILFAGLADPAARPALFHCTTGKDRTGWAAAALLLYLGVPGEAVMDDFLASTRNLGTALQPFLDAFKARGGDPEVLRPLVGVHPEYLEIAIAEVGRVFGSIDAYLADGLGLDADARHRLHTAFVEPG